MIKAAKKLKKLWPRKKKRKRTYQEPYYYLPPQPSCHCCCSYSTPVQPSAPPLPPWLEPEQAHEIISSTDEVQQLSEVGYQSQVQSPCQEIVVETTTNTIYPSLPNIDTSLTYQQYTVPNPVYSVPVVEQTPGRERSAGFFGCFVKFGANLIRRFCPCFHLREVD